MDWVNVLVHITLIIGVLSFLLFINMYIITDVTIIETVAVTNTLTTHAIAIAAPSDEVLESNSNIYIRLIMKHMYIVT